MMVVLLSMGPIPTSVYAYSQHLLDFEFLNKLMNIRKILNYSKNSSSSTPSPQKNIFSTAISYAQARIYGCTKVHVLNALFQFYCITKGSGTNIQMHIRISNNTLVLTRKLFKVFFLILQFWISLQGLTKTLDII